MADAADAEMLRRTASVQRHFRRLSLMLHETPKGLIAGPETLPPSSSWHGSPSSQGADHDNEAGAAGVRLQSSSLFSPGKESAASSIAKLLTPVSLPETKSSESANATLGSSYGAGTSSKSESDLRAIFDLCASKDDGHLNATQFKEAVLTLRPNIESKTAEDIFYRIVALTGETKVSWGNFLKICRGDMDTPEMSAIIPKNSKTLIKAEHHALVTAAGPKEESRTIDSELRRHIDQLKTQLAKEQQARLELSDKLSGLRQEHVVLEDRVEIIDKLNARIVDLESEAVYHKKIISEEKMSRSLAEREASEAESQRETAMDSCADLQQQLSNAIALLEQSNQDRERALSEKNMLEVELKSEQENSKECSRSHDIARNKSESLQQELKRAQEMLSRSEREKKELASASEFANRSLEDTQQKLKTATFELSVEKEARHEAERRHETVIQENSELRAKNVRFQEVIRLAKQREELIADEKSKCEIKLAAIENTVQRLKSELAQERERTSGSTKDQEELLDDSVLNSRGKESLNPSATSNPYEMALLTEHQVEIKSLRSQLESVRKEKVLQEEATTRESTRFNARLQDLQKQLDEIMGAYSHDQRKWASEKDKFKFQKSELQGKLESATGNVELLKEKIRSSNEMVKELKLENEKASEEISQTRSKCERDLRAIKQEQADNQADADAAATRLHASIASLQKRLKECQKHAEQEKQIFSQNLQAAQDMRARAETLLASHMAERKIALQEQSQICMAEAQEIIQQERAKYQKREVEFRSKEQKIMDDADAQLSSLRAEYEQKVNELKAQNRDARAKIERAEEAIAHAKEDATKKIRAAKDAAARETDTRVDEVNESFKKEVATLRKAVRSAEAEARDALAAKESETLALSQSLRLLRDNIDQADKRTNQLQEALQRRKIEQDRAESAAKNEKDHLEAELSKVKNSLNEFKDEKYELQVHVDQVSEKLDRKISEYNQIEAKLSKACEETMRIKSILIETELARDSALTSANTSKSNEKLAAVQWQEERSILTERAKSEADYLQRQISELRDELKKANSQASVREQNFIQELNSAISSAEDRERSNAALERKRFESELNRLEAQLNEQKYKEHSLRNLFDSKQSALQQEVDASREKIRHLKDVAREEIRGLANMIKASEEREREGNELLQICEKKLSEAQHKNKILAEEAQNYKSNENSQKAGIEELRVTHAAVEERLEKVTDKMESMAAQLASAKALAESETERALSAEESLEKFRYGADMREKKLLSQISILETRHVEIEQRLNESQRAAALYEAEKNSSFGIEQQKAEMTRLKLANMRAEAKIVTLSNELSATNSAHVEKQERANQELRAQRNEVRRLEVEAGKLIHERADRAELLSELQKARKALLLAREKHDQARNENTIVASEAERVVARMASQQQSEKRALEMIANSAKAQLVETQDELETLKEQYRNKELDLAELKTALQVSREDISRSRAEARNALQAQEVALSRVMSEQAYAKEMEKAMSVAELQNGSLERETGQLDDDKAKLERSIQEREILSSRVKQELNEIRVDFKEFLETSKRFGQGPLGGELQEAVSFGDRLTTPISGRQHSDGMKSNPNSEQIGNGLTDSSTKIEISKRGSIHISRSHY